MHSLGQYFSCNWISILRLACLCPPLEVAQDAPLVVMQGRLGEWLYGPEWDLWKLCWSYVLLFPSSSSMMLGRSAGIGFVRVGLTLWGRKGLFRFRLFLWRVQRLVHISSNLGKDIWELINSYHLGVSNIRKRSFWCWVLQGMGQLVRWNDDIYWWRTVRERSIVQKKINTVLITPPYCSSNVNAMAPKVNSWLNYLNGIVHIAPHIICLRFTHRYFISLL